MKANHLAPLYRIAVDYFPPDEYDMRYGRSGHGRIELSEDNGDGRWSEAWEQATRTEKIRYTGWHANLICRVLAALAHELEESGHHVRHVFAHGVVDPVKRVDDDDLLFIDVTVEHDEAKKWVARTKQLVNEVIAADAAALAAADTEQAHAGVMLTNPDNHTASQEERTL
jgi:hypothetical protein